MEPEINIIKINEIDKNVEQNNKKEENSIMSIDDTKYVSEIIKMTEAEEPKDMLTFKIIIIGNSGVGKTSITTSAVKNVFINDYKSTIGMEIFSLYLKVNDKPIKLQIWDTCGQEIYRSLIKNFYRNSSLAIIVYSIDKKNSFKDINLWIKEIRVNSSPDIKIVLIGNKSDLDKDRQVSYEEGKKYLDDDEVLKFFETSAKTGENIKKLFQEISIILYKDYKYFNKGNLTRSSGSFKAKKADLSKKKSKCC
jgi:small GTP-binding protein